MMEESSGLEVEYLTDTGLQRRPSLKLPSYIGPYHPDSHCDDLVLSCELYRLTCIYRTQLEDTPVKLALAAVLHFRKHPHSEVRLMYDSSETIAANRICRDPLYEVYYCWFQQLLQFINALIFSWSLWPTRSFTHRKSSLSESRSSLLSPIPGLSLPCICLAGCCKRLNSHSNQSAEAFESAFESFCTSLLNLNKNADFTKVNSLAEEIYEKSYRVVTTTRQFAQILPETGSIPPSARKIKQISENLRLFLLHRPTVGLLKCCVGAGDREVVDGLETVIQLYSEWEQMLAM